MFYFTCLFIDDSNDKFNFVQEESKILIQYILFCRFNKTIGKSFKNLFDKKAIFYNNIFISIKFVYLIALVITIARSLVIVDKIFPSLVEKCARPFNSPVISRDVSQIGTSPTDGDNAASWNSSTSSVEWPSAAQREIFRSAMRTSTILVDFAPIVDRSVASRRDG